MFTPDLQRPPAPDLTPEELLRVTEFEFLPGAFEETDHA